MTTIFFGARSIKFGLNRNKKRYMLGENVFMIRLAVIRMKLLNRSLAIFSSRYGISGRKLEVNIRMVCYAC